MANAKICDRCRVYYQERDPNYIESLTYALNAMVMPQSEQKCVATIESFLDLCPNCSKSLKRWLKGDKEVADD